MTALRLCAEPLAFYMPPDYPMTWYSTQQGNTGRARIAGQILSRPGRHLLIVRYAAGHDFFEEWVYNDASIDESRIVWARELDEASNRALLPVFP